MGLYVDTINKIFDVVEAAKAPTKELEYVKNVYFGEQNANTKGLSAYVWIHMAPTSIEETWAAARDQRSSLFTVLLDCAFQAPVAARPYGLSGDPAKRGILVLVEDLMNLLDNKRSDILGASIRSVDMNLTVGETASLGEDYLGAVVACEIKKRFPAGAR